LGKVATVLLLLALAVTGFAGYSEMRFRQLSDALDAEIATYKRQRWDRPSLRGAAGEGNASSEAVATLDDFTGITSEQRDALAAHAYYGSPLAAPDLALLDQHKQRIAKLRSATLNSWAMNEMTLERGDVAGPPSYPLVMDAVLLALADGARVSADECLLACADVIRLGQDLVPGAPIEAASVSMRITSVASPMIARCAAQANPDALYRAAREFQVLAMHPPPTGGSIEVADLMAKVELRALAELLPDDSGDSPFTRLRRRPALLDAWAYFDNPARWRELSADRYPQALETWLKEHQWRARSGMRLVARATSDIDGWLLDDMRGQALVRAQAVGLATLAERTRRKRMPREPINLDDPALRDPFNGQPLKWRMSADAAELTLWSIGEDRRDDKGSTEWTPQAPRDVVAYFKLRSLEPPEPTKRTPKRRATPNAAEPAAASL
jgi:hypothetical protein